MKTGIGPFVLGCILGVACKPGYVDESNKGARKALISEVTPRWFDDPFVNVPNPFTPIAESRSFVLRVDNEVFGDVDVGQLEEGHTMTLWYGVFGDPEKCTKPHECGIEDFLNPRVNAGFYRSRAGGYVDGTGHVHLSGWPIENGEKEKLRLGSTLSDALSDEIMMVVRSHGPKIPGLEEEQIATWFGGCARTGDPRATFECFTIAYANHKNFEAYKTLATEAEMSKGAPRGTEAEMPVEGSRFLLARGEPFGVVMGYVDTMLTPNQVISVSWYVFNEPTRCALGAGLCRLEDVDDPAVDATVIDQRGGLVDEDGRLYVPVGPLLAEGDYLPRVGSEVRLDSAEIVLVLRSHGPELPDRLEEQMTTYEGGCDVNDCADVQFARLLPSR